MTAITVSRLSKIQVNYPLIKQSEDLYDYCYSFKNLHFFPTAFNHFFSKLVFHALNYRLVVSHYFKRDIFTVAKICPGLSKQWLRPETFVKETVEKLFPRVIGRLFLITD